MTAEELFNTYPKAAEAVNSYYKKIFLDAIENEDLKEEYKEIARTQLIDNEWIISFINRNPRGCFDGLDENGVFIEINILISEEPRFMYHVNGEVNVEPFYTSRKEAEAAAIEKAFQILNEKLCI
jgi:hypothetical protein